MAAKATMPEGRQDPNTLRRQAMTELLQSRHRCIQSGAANM